MLTLFHSPNSRSTRIIALLHAMDAMDKVDIRPVTIVRQDGSGGRDPANPHPEGKVPLLVDNGVEIWESSAIMIHLTDLFPEADLGLPHGHKDRGRFLSWMVWYGSVVEPVMVFDATGMTHPFMTATFRGRTEMLARLSTALKDAPWLMGDHYTAADLLLASPFLWFPDAVPADPVLADWIARCGAQECSRAAIAYDNPANAA